MSKTPDGFEIPRKVPNPPPQVSANVTTLVTNLEYAKIILKGRRSGQGIADSKNVSKLVAKRIKDLQGNRAEVGAVQWKDLQLLLCGVCQSVIEELEKAYPSPPEVLTDEPHS